MIIIGINELQDIFHKFPDNGIYSNVMIKTYMNVNKTKLLIPKHHGQKLDIKNLSLKSQIWSNARMIAVLFFNIKQTEDWFTNIKFKLKQNKIKEQ